MRHQPVDSSESLKTGSLEDIHPQCRMPNGYTGECKYLDKCKPLKEVSEKKVKTDNELLYLRESSCGTTSNYLYKVCCPPQSEWSKKLDLKPIPFPEIINYLAEPGSNGTSQKSSDDTKSTTVLRDGSNKETEECGVEVSGPKQDRDYGTADIDEYPWMALLEYRFGRIMCGGSLISPNFILTAAHCIETTHGKPAFARLAEYNMTSFPTDYVEVDGGATETITVSLIAVKWSEKHPMFDKNTYHHDIGLVKLAEDAKSSDFIRPICLPRYNFADQFDTNTNFITAGWGVHGSINNDIKMEAKLPYMPIPTCKRSISIPSLTNKQLCAGGVASYGPDSCSNIREPTVYTYVYEYLDWIDSVMV
ncbi:Serine protease easter [Papilio xuthus]|uniref:CLIP domain-containing serine protease n=1 Tax=Papilio xuthus TaxID=66420 RepID=A0A0N1I2Q4_PAPXU|nr:Serine protease easter [Papilio xuthus]